MAYHIGMSDLHNTPSPPPAKHEIPASTPLQQPNWAARIFVGPLGLRGGWRVLIFMALLVGIVLGGIPLVRAIGLHHPPGAISPRASLLGEILLFLSVMIATAVMGPFERRSFAASQAGNLLRPGKLFPSTQPRSLPADHSHDSRDYTDRDDLRRR